MSRSLSRKNSLIVPFMAAFVGMLVAVPVAVTASVVVAKASLGSDKAELAYALSELSRQYDERPQAALAYAHQNECVGRAEEVKEEREREEKPTVVYVPVYRDRAPQPGYYDGYQSRGGAPTTVNNITTTTSNEDTEIEDSTIDIDKTKNIDSHNTASKNTANTNSQNNSGNSNSGNTNNSNNTANLAGRDQTNNGGRSNSDQPATAPVPPKQTKQTSS